MRKAIAERAERALAEDTQERLRDVPGAVRGGGRRARDSGRAFTDLLAERRRQP
ncbi:MAG TPA: hypothetical protein VIC05_06945 [Solirubrobacteraceae bacterium]|jgi:hypothetical protein